MQDEDEFSTIELGDHDPNETLRLLHEDAASTDDTVLAGKWVFGKELGRGGMAVIREAVQPNLRRVVAIKSPRQSSHLTRYQVHQQLMMEARVAGALEHPSILPVHDVVFEDDEPHIVMKKVLGWSWSELIHDKEKVRELFDTDLLDWNLEVLEDVCQALGLAHKNYILHRDLKPDNVMVGKYGEVYLVDWGIAVTTDDADNRFPQLRHQQSLVGTPHYMAPEMLTRKGLTTLSPSTDIYMLGAILHEILSGLPPHQGSNTKEVLRSIKELKVSLPGSPEPLVRLTKQCLQRDPNDRLQSADQFRQQLRDYRLHRGTLSLRADALEKLQQLKEAVQQGEEANRIELYRLFGGCQFGLAEVLRVWPDDEEAGLAKSALLTTLALWEIAQGDDRAAEALLANLQEVEPTIKEQIEALRVVRQEKEARLIALERDANTTYGQGVLFLTSMALTTIWVISPPLAYYNHNLSLPLTGATFLLLLVCLVLAHRMVAATARNRGVFQLVFATILSDLLLDLGVLLHAISYDGMLSVSWVVNGMCCLLLAFAVDKRFYIPYLFFVLFFLTAEPLRAFRPFLASFVALVVGGTGFWVFFPTHLFRSKST